MQRKVRIKYEGQETEIEIGQEIIEFIDEISAVENIEPIEFISWLLTTHFDSILKAEEYFNNLESEFLRENPGLLN